MAAAPLRRPTRLGEEVYNALYARLMSHAIPPGGRIAVDSLVRELGVSHTPIREALSRLEAQGLVVKTHLIGYSAAPRMEPDRLGQLYDLRMLLEPFAAARAAEAMTPETLAALESLAGRMEAIAGNEPRAGYGRFARLDGEFHDLVALAGGNALVRESLARLHTHVHLFRHAYHARATQDAVEEHRRLLDALSRADQRAAAAAMRRHVRRSRARFLSAVAD